jgi:hypothetical protein
VAGDSGEARRSRKATAGHQYLDAADDEVTVEASLGEYGDAW